MLRRCVHMFRRLIQPVNCSVLLRLHQVKLYFSHCFVGGLNWLGNICPRAYCSQSLVISRLLVWHLLVVWFFRPKRLDRHFNYNKFRYFQGMLVPGILVTRWAHKLFPLSTHCQDLLSLGRCIRGGSLRTKRWSWRGRPRIASERLFSLRRRRCNTIGAKLLRLWGAWWRSTFPAPRVAALH